MAGLSVPIVGAGKARKALMVGASEQTEEMKMNRIITQSELQNRNLEELKVAFHKAQQDLAMSAPNSPERRNALASLENIQRAMSSRQTLRPKPPGF